jgi:DNA modification methylase
VIRHPARFSQPVLQLVERHRLLPDIGIVLDPMAGVGGVHTLATIGRKTIGIEIEPEWAAAHADTMVGNCLRLPFGRASFDAVFTSPCYGNRLSDHHRASDPSVRRSYTHDLQYATGDPERRLHADNSGTLRATKGEYWAFHARAWAEVHRVLRPGGRFVLNVSDHIARGEVVPVVERHADLVLLTGFTLIKEFRTTTRRMRYGANNQARVPTESVLVFDREY